MSWLRVGYELKCFNGQSRSELTYVNRNGRGHCVVYGMCVKREEIEFAKIKRSKRG